jgi:hypothetical protein
MSSSRYGLAFACPAFGSFLARRNGRAAIGEVQEVIICERPSTLLSLTL